MVDTRNQKESRENAERRSSSENHSSNSAAIQVKEEMNSDDQNSSVSDSNARCFITRSKMRRLERRRAYSSHSSAIDSDNRKAKSEPIIITLDSDSDDNISVISSRPNRTARIRGELIRKLSGTTTKITKYKACESSSSSESEKIKRKKKPKQKSVKASSVQSSKSKKYLVSRLACQSRLNSRRHQKAHISHVYRPIKKTRHLRSLSKRFERQKKEKQTSKGSNIPVKKTLNPSSVCIERRSLRSASTDTTVDNLVKTEIVTDVKSQTRNENIKQQLKAPQQVIKSETEDIKEKASEFLNEKEVKQESTSELKQNDEKEREKMKSDTESDVNMDSKETVIEPEIPSAENNSLENSTNKEKVKELLEKENSPDICPVESLPSASPKGSLSNNCTKVSNNNEPNNIDENVSSSHSKENESNSHSKENVLDIHSKESTLDSHSKKSASDSQPKEIASDSQPKENMSNSHTKENISNSQSKESVPNIRIRESESNSNVKENESNIRPKEKGPNIRLRESESNSRPRETTLNMRPRESASIGRPSDRMKRIKKKIKPTDKTGIRKRGRPRLSELKPVKEIPILNDMIQIPFLQSSFCFNVAPKLPKCRECRIAVNRSSRSLLHAYCRFMEYRKLCYSKNGTILNAGFSEPSEATSEHLNQWLPQLNNPPKDLNFNTAKALVEHIGDQFCDLIEQEKEALSLHIGMDRVITWKRIVQGVREMCDVCYTTLFNIHWVCPICGLAVCIDCYKGRKQGIVFEDEEGQAKNRDEYNWLLCTSLRQPHDPEKLLMAQIIPGNALWHMRDLLHKARKKWNIPSYCRCNPQAVTAPDKYVSTGICKQLMCFVTKSFSTERSSMYYSNDSNVHNGDNNYDELDIEVTGAALKWLEGAVSSSSLESLRHGDDYFNSYEDYASLRGNLLNGLEDEDIISESDREFTSFSLDDIIECVTKPQNVDNKENSGKAIVKHFSNRYPQANSGRDPLPIRIYTKLESNLAFSSVPHSWFCNGRLLFLHQTAHNDNLALFQEQWKRGQPILVKGVDERLNMDLWHPDAFCRDFGEIRNDLVDCRSGAIIKNLPMKKFWEGFESFEKRLKDDNGEYRLLKLKDWPPGEDFSEMLPKRFHDLMDGLPLPEYTHRDGILNLAGRLPSWFVRPDLGPKMYNAYGSALYPTKGTTNLHLDVSDAVNVMVYVGIPSDGNAQLHIEEALKAIDEGGCDSLMRARVRSRGAKPGALWHIYNARDADKIREMLTKIALERGEKLEAYHDPIHDQSWYLDAELRKRLYRDYGVEGYAIAQCLGDAVFIPAGAPHQVRNLHSCVKVAEDFVSPENIAHCFKLTQEFRHLSDTHTNHEDKLQIKNIIYHVVRDSLAYLLTEADIIES